MKTARGMGNVYQPTYVDRRTRERRTCVTWWIVYSVKRAENRRERAFDQPRRRGPSLEAAHWSGRDGQAGGSSARSNDGG
jgi:hypothetical protein